MKRITFKFTLFFSLCFTNIFAQLTSSELPIILIDTEGKTIVDEPKVNVKFQILYDQSGGLNYVNSTNFYYDGFAGVEFRGSFSQNWPKKNISLELRTDTTTNDEDDFSLFGFPEESDWILTANYNDRSHLKNAISYEFFRRSGVWAPNTFHCELIINGNYQGLYMLTERIKRDKNRVDIKKLDDNDTSPSKISGGYLIGNNDNDAVDEGWTSNNGPIQKTFEISYPNDPLTIQADYIEEYFNDMEEAFNSPNFSDPTTGFRAYLEEESFARNIVFQEFSKNADAYFRSQYFYKERGEKLNAGPIWDFDFAYGLKFSGYDAPYGWQIVNWPNPELFWYQKLRLDCDFMSLVRETYDNIRANSLIQSDVISYIDSVELLIAPAALRDNNRWHSSKSDSFQDVVDDLETWVHTRFAWMDENIHNIANNAPSLSSSMNTVDRNDMVTFTISGCNSSAPIQWHLKNDFENTVLPFSTNSISIPISVNSYIVANCNTGSCIVPSKTQIVEIEDPCEQVINISSLLSAIPAYQIFHAGENIISSSSLPNATFLLKAGNSILLQPGFETIADANAFTIVSVEECPQN